MRRAPAHRETRVARIARFAGETSYVEARALAACSKCYRELSGAHATFACEDVRIEPPLYQTLEAVARQERPSVAQAALRLMEDGLRQRLGGPLAVEDLTGDAIGEIAREGGAFDWLADEPDTRDAASGESLRALPGVRFREEGRVEERARLARLHAAGGTVLADLSLTS